MTTQICSCEGLNPNCEKCFGSGYMISSESGKSSTTQPNAKKTTEKKPKYESYLPQEIQSLSKKEVENISIKIIDALDTKSKKQMQILNSIPFNSTTFRRDFKDKFVSLKTLENAKQFLRNELNIISKETTEKKHLKFSHLLSDTEIDVDSNRQLKDLIREYKKLKTKK